MNLTETFLRYKADPSPDNYDVLGLELLRYIRLFVKRSFKGRCVPHELQDINSDALLEILKSLPTFEVAGKAAFNTWVGSIVLNRGREYIASRAKRNECALAPIAQSSSSADRLLLRALIAKLDPYDKLFTQLKLRGFTNAEVAERLGMPIGTADWRWKVIQQKLRTLGGGK